MAPKKWFCRCCQKRLGKGSKACPPLWRHMFGWVRFNCSGLKSKSATTTTFRLQNVRKVKFWLKIIIPLRLPILRFTMPTKTLITQRLLAVAKNCSEVANAHPSMLIATWTRVKLTQSTNLPESVSRDLRLWVISWMKFGPLIRLTCNNLPRKIRELGISSWQWIHWVGFYG